jgi:cytochrome P450
MSTSSRPLCPGLPLLNGGKHMVSCSSFLVSLLSFWVGNNCTGPIFYFRIFSNKVIVLNSGEAALDLLESRSTIYSDRPITWMLGELAGRKMSAFLMPYHHPRFRKYRTFLHTGLNPRAAQTYRPIQEQETLIFLQGLAETPDSFVKHIRR